MEKRWTAQHSMDYLPMKRVAQIDDICIKLTGWRMRSYPLEVFANNELIWSGNTEKSLGYVHLPVNP